MALLVGLMRDWKKNLIIPARHPNNCLYAFEVADWLPLARAYLSLQTGCLLLMRLNISVSVFVPVYVSVYASAYDMYLNLYLYLYLYL